MATTPSAPDALNTNLEKPQTSGNGSGQTLQYDNGQKSDWWFASTAIPLLAATLSPLANVLSICALVTSWRETIYIDGNPVAEFDGVPFPDPKWCYWLNVASLVAGFLGNLFLLLNFTQRVRYLIALPATIILWYVSTGFLIGITACMEIYAPPSRPEETYSQGFWYAIAAAVFYLICSMILMVNMLGYFLGHYPDHFALTDAQRTLILQTMLFFIWLAGGGAVFSRIESDVGQDGWAFTDAVYFCDVTILTVGFGDLYPTTDLGRGIVFPYSVGGTIMLGLVISSLYKFMQQLGEENIVQKHVQRTRQRTLSRAVTNSFDLREREHAAHHLIRKRHPKGSAGAPKISGPTQARAYRTAMGNTVRRVTNPLTVPKPLRRKPRLILLREEKDRFDEMRRIQRQTNKFKKWYALIFSLAAFALLWCVGAVVFWQCEKNTQNMTYFQALYFCYVSLLTIGYGDLAPKSNAGRCFFVVWSLVAVPTMTILVSDLGDTVIAKFKKWSDDLADFTVLPKEGIWREFLDKNPWLLYWFQKWQAARAEKAAKKRVERGFDTVDPESVAEGNIDVEDADLALDLTLPTLATEAEQDISGHVPSLATLSRRIAVSIRKVAADLRFSPPKKYDYEEWVEFTRLIRFTKKSAGDRGEGVLEEEDEEGLVEWDWIGDDSPMMSGMCESEWILQRLTESLVRLERRREATARLEAVAEERSDCVPASDEDRVLASGADGPAS
ncbi:voltage-gated potassium channel [Polyplosphaeria fusca]|uniref:Voltage-gated potassium channel n=1 Tax=Polyplosphaeria fusca TaxID=682080 RepID=A0A9P4R4L8_9PLEO|nr:voltage-gated potassium channel [Polyplosphaeria fusca]